MAENKVNYYDKEYYESHCGDEYVRGNGWEEVFANHAEHIVKEIAPKKTLDIGCAKGFLVEALRDRGVEAYGIDISDYAISEVRDDIKPFCKVKSATLPIEEKYDLITCIEVLEHLENEDIAIAIQRMCEATDDIIFSSTPFDYNEASHISVHSPSYWVEQFAYNGFYHDVKYDCSYIAVQTMRFRRAEKTMVDLIRDYESILFEKTQEVIAARQNQRLAEDNVKIYKDAYQKHVDMINQELNPRIAELEQQLEAARKEAKEIQKKLVDETEEKCRSQVEALIQDKKDMEQDLYEAKEKEEASYAKLDEARKINSNLLKDRNALLSRSVFDFVKKQRLHRQEQKELVEKGREYWAPVFDAEYYAKTYDDIRNALGTDEGALLNHFLEYGVYEGRSGNKEFNISRYMELNKDVVEYYFGDNKAACMHYIDMGRFENRSI